MPWSLTGAQRQAISEIAADMAAPHAMLRLLQGDVGAGKTLVALLALLIAVEAGAQGALLAPTDLLARPALCGATDRDVGKRRILPRLRIPACRLPFCRGAKKR